MAEWLERQRSAALESAFAHITERAAGADIAGIDDPSQQWLITLRYMIDDYGNVGDFDTPGINFIPVDAGGVPAEWVTAPNSSHNARIVFLHGGGWAGGSARGYRPITATLARLSRASVLAIDYRLAPEHKFPAGLDDCVSAFTWATMNGPGSSRRGLPNSDPASFIGIAGDSAGGNLCAATTFRLIKAGARLPDRVALISGTLDNHSNADRIGKDDPICPPEVLAACNHLYLDATTSTDAYLVSPALAPDDLFREFPPTLLQVGILEALLWDSKRFAGRLEANGVRHNLSVWPDVPHVWHAFLTTFPEAEMALKEIADFMRFPQERSDATTERL